MTKIHFCSPFTQQTPHQTSQTNASLLLLLLPTPRLFVLRCPRDLPTPAAQYRQLPVRCPLFRTTLRRAHSPARSANCFDPPHAVVLPTTTKAVQRHPATARQHPLLGLLQLLVDCASVTLETSDHVQTVVQTSNHQSRIPPDGPSRA